MSRFDGDRIDDIAAAIDAIRSHILRGDLDDNLVLDAVRVRLIEIGEAVKALSPELTATEPEIPWRQITRMRDHLAHRYLRHRGGGHPKHGRARSRRARRFDWSDAATTRHVSGSRQIRMPASASVD